MLWFKMVSIVKVNKARNKQMQPTKRVLTGVLGVGLGLLFAFIHGARERKIEKIGSEIRSGRLRQRSRSNWRTRRRTRHLTPPRVSLAPNQRHKSPRPANQRSGRGETMVTASRRMKDLVLCSGDSTVF